MYGVTSAYKENQNAEYFLCRKIMLNTRIGRLDLRTHVTHKRVSFCIYIKVKVFRYKPDVALGVPGG
jgi:hypothetical protein